MTVTWFPWRFLGNAEPGSIAPVTSTIASKSPSTSANIMGALCSDFLRLRLLTNSGERVCSLLPGTSILNLKPRSSLIRRQSRSGSMNGPSNEKLFFRAEAIMRSTLPGGRIRPGLSGSESSFGLE